MPCAGGREETATTRVAEDPSERSAALTSRVVRVALGRLPTQDDNRRAAQVCVIGQTVRFALFETRDPIGQDMRVHDMACRVIGVLEPKGASAFGLDQDDRRTTHEFVSTLARCGTGGAGQGSKGHPHAHAFLSEPRKGNRRGHGGLSRRRL